jgi:hypothetical protein
MRKKSTGLLFVLVAFAALFAGCADDGGSGGLCVPNGNIACTTLFAPVCVQNSHGAYCYEGNQCVAQAKCETVVCNLSLDINLGGIIDPDTDCAKSHPDCLNSCL